MFVNTIAVVGGCRVEMPSSAQGSALIDKKREWESFRTCLWTYEESDFYTSSSKHTTPEIKQVMSDTEEGGIPLMEPLSPSASPEPETRPAGSKRKREDGDEDEAPVPQTKAAKRKKAKNAKKAKQPKDIEEDALDLEAGVNHAIAHMDSQLLADHVAQRTKRFHTELSDMELEDLHIPCQSTTCATIYTRVLTQNQHSPLWIPHPGTSRATWRICPPSSNSSRTKDEATNQERPCRTLSSKSQHHTQSSLLHLESELPI
jgi:hypothetical protein